MSNSKRMAHINKWLVAGFCTVLVGCGKSGYEVEGSGELRLEIFKECMELAKDTVRDGHYNDSAEVIGECGNQARYISTQIKQTTEQDN